MYIARFDVVNKCLMLFIAVRRDKRRFLLELLPDVVFSFHPFHYLRKVMNFPTFFPHAWSLPTQ